jgi:hypothetical protein
MAATSTLTAPQSGGTAPAPTPVTEPAPIGADQTFSDRAFTGRHRAPGTARRTNRGPGRHRAGTGRARSALRAAVVVAVGVAALPLAAGPATADPGAGPAAGPADQPQPTVMLAPTVVHQPPAVIATRPNPTLIATLPTGVLTAAPTEPAPVDGGIGSTASPSSTPTAAPTPSPTATAATSPAGAAGSAPADRSAGPVAGRPGHPGARTPTDRRAAPGGAAAGSTLTGQAGTAADPATTPVAATNSNLPLTIGVSLALLLGILFAASAGFRLVGRHRAEPAAA